MKWIEITKDNLPELDRPLFLANETGAWLGVRTYIKNEGWLWAYADGAAYTDNGELCIDGMLEDGDVPTHYAYVELPKKSRKIKPHVLTNDYSYL